MIQNIGIIFANRNNTFSDDKLFIFKLFRVGKQFYNLRIEYEKSVFIE